jgi:hypothetical protein
MSETIVRPVNKPMPKVSALEMERMLLVAAYELTDADSFGNGRADEAIVEMTMHQNAGRIVTQERDHKRHVWVFRVYQPVVKGD